MSMPPLCNLRLASKGKLMQVKPIAAGEALSWDYGMQYWVRRVTGLDFDEWMSDKDAECRKFRDAFFTEMHESVSNYSRLLQQPWVGSLTSASTMVDRETMLAELVDFLNSDTVRCGQE